MSIFCKCSCYLHFNKCNLITIMERQSSCVFLPLEDEKDKAGVFWKNQAWQNLSPNKCEDNKRFPSLQWIYILMFGSIAKINCLKCWAGKNNCQGLEYHAIHSQLLLFLSKKNYILQLLELQLLESSYQVSVLPMVLNICTLLVRTEIQHINFP